MTHRVAAARVLRRRLPDGWLLLAVDGGDPTRLTGTATELWDLLAEPRDDEELAATLAARHGAPVPTVAADVATALDDLARRGLVEVAAPPADRVDP